MKEEIFRSMTIFFTLTTPPASRQLPAGHKGPRILVNGSRISNLWDDQFSALGKSRCSSNPEMAKYVSSVADIEFNSFLTCDSVLDCVIVVDEVNQGIQHFKGKCWLC